MATKITAGLPTPAPSSEIQAKPTALSSPMDQEADGPFPFSLPPAAISSTPSTRTSSIASSIKPSSESSYAPLSPPPSVPIKAKQSASSRRRRSAANNQSHDDYNLPPPPTRTRKIIQMKPRGQKEHGIQSIPLVAPNAQTSKYQALISPDLKAPAKVALTVATTVNTPSTGSKRKQPSSPPTTAAGRKMARKTAHSLIERRRRSKMNEEFGVLKDMIPACAGQDMHKLAILQASIEYMCYLEKCLADLKATHSHAQCPWHRPSSPMAQPAGLATAHSSPRSTSAAPVSEEIEVVELPSIRHVLAVNPGPQASLVSQQPGISSLTHPPSTQHSPLHRGASCKHLPPPLPDSGLPSPAYELAPSKQAYKSFSFTSPVIAPTDDHEATAALLMLNTDRRSWSERGTTDGSVDADVPGHKRIGRIHEQTTRGMSVKDLLTT